MEKLVEHVIERVYLPTSTPGSWYDEKGQLVCKTLEPRWLNNQRDNKATEENDASCIPEGTYIVRKNPPKPSRNYGYFRFDHVEGRSGILVHRITYVKDLLGCIGVGGRHVDLNKDGIPDIVDSSKKLQWMYENLPEVFKLTIIERRKPK